MRKRTLVVLEISEIGSEQQLCVVREVLLNETRTTEEYVEEIMKTIYHNGRVFVEEK